MPSNRKAKIRVWIAFLFLLIFMVVLSVGVYYVPDLAKLQQHFATRESQAPLQGGGTEPGQSDEAPGPQPSSKFQQIVTIATRAANETNAATEKLSAEVEPPAISKSSNLGAASRDDLEALRRDLKTAEANAKTFMPRYSALLKTERDKIEKYALSQRAEKDNVSRLLNNIDKRHAETTALTSQILSARAELYRAYENYVAFLVGEFGTYKVVDGHFIFPVQSTVDRYNAAARAMTVASNRVAELGEARKRLLKSQQDGWKQFVSGND